MNFILFSNLFLFVALLGQSQKGYYLDLNGVNYEFQRVVLEDGFTDIYVVKSDDGKPKYLLYVIESSSSKDDSKHSISDIYGDANFVHALYRQLNCFPRSKAKKVSKDYTLGYETLVEFENVDRKSKYQAYYIRR